MSILRFANFYSDKIEFPQSIKLKKGFLTSESNIMFCSDKQWSESHVLSHIFFKYSRIIHKIFKINKKHLLNKADDVQNLIYIFFLLKKLINYK